MTTFQRAALLVLAFALAAAVPPAAGRAAGAAPRSHLAGRYYQIDTTVVQYNFGTGNFTAPAKLTVTRPGLEVVADSAKGNMKTGSALLTGNVHVHDSGGPGSAQGRNATEAATLTCDQLDVDGKADTYHATGHPHYETATRSADADDMLLDRKQKKLHLTGNVKLKDGVRSGASNNVDIDLKTGDVEMRGAPVKLRAPVSPLPQPSPKAKAKPNSPRGPSPNATPSP